MESDSDEGPPGLARKRERPGPSRDLKGGAAGAHFLGFLVPRRGGPFLDLEPAVSHPTVPMIGSCVHEHSFTIVSVFGRVVHELEFMNYGIHSRSSTNPVRER